LPLRSAMKHVLPLAFLCIGFARPIVLAQQSPSKPPELPHPATLDELKQAMAHVVTDTKIPGAGVALISRGQLLWCGGFGKADIAAQRDITCDTEFRVGSISKTFVALALLQLEQAGKIDLRARLRDLAPEVPLRNRWVSTDPVRVVNLLEHTAGFDDMHFSEVYNYDDAPGMPLLKVLQAHPHPQDVRWPPSTRFSYSNPGYGIAGYLIQKVSGQPFDAYIRANILAPLLFTAGDFDLTDANRALLAQGYQGNPPHLVPYKNIYLRPAGDLKASPAELARVVQFFLRRGATGDIPGIRPESIARMEYPATPLSARNGLRLGYGLANYSEIQAGVVTHGHDGGIDGFISTYRYMPEQNWGFVVLLNSDSSGKALRDLGTLAADFLSRDFPKHQQPVIALAPADLRKFAGYYASRAPRNQFFAFMDELTGGDRIRVRGDILVRSPLFGAGEALYPVGKNLFRTEKDPEATAVFFPNANGTMCYVAFGRNGEPYAERSSILWVYARIAVLVLCGIAFASALLYAVVWLLLGLFGGLRGVRHLAVRVVPFLAVVVCLASFYSATRALNDLGRIDFWSVMVFLGTTAFPLLSLFALWLAVYVPRGNPSRRPHSLAHGGGRLLHGDRLLRLLASPLCPPLGPVIHPEVPEGGHAPNPPAEPRLSPNIASARYHKAR
jgi:CubicO group peptidase (beta-lactamase class C family)